MTRVITSQDCGNSPKNIFAQELSIALARGENQFLLDRATEDILWDQVGKGSYQGKPAFGRALEATLEKMADELVIHHVVTHGKAGAVNCTLRMENGEIHELCHVFEFSSAKGTLVRGIRSYDIRTR